MVGKERHQGFETKIPNHFSIGDAVAVLVPVIFLEIGSFRSAFGSNSSSINSDTMLAILLSFQRPAFVGQEQ